MLVYGDRARTADPRIELQGLLDAIAKAEALPPGIVRHAALVGALIACGELAQGLADAAFDARGEDARDPAADLALQATRTLAEAVIRSWRGGFARAPAEPAALEALLDGALPERVTLKEGEGFAFYALYPETYAEAAAALPPAPTTVVGLRSIGTSLGAMVAAALGTERFISVRPTGDPFARTVEVDRGLDAPAEHRVAVVDEGPGLSGSSFGAALDWALVGNASREALAFPSHAGDLGPEASSEHRRRWATLSRPNVSFEALIAPRLAEWVEDLTGPATDPLRDLSGGAWRSLRYGSEAEWPAVNAGQERRKFLLRTERGAYLLKFAGLGRIGERKLARARRLAAAGFTPEPIGLRHGFLVEPWIASRAPPSREAILERLPSYLRFRQEAFHATPEDGAGLEAVFEMARVNVAEAFGAEAALRLGPWRARLPELSGLIRRVQTDNRLHSHEWIAAPGGGVLKTDALDHAEAHDLVGAQDIAWDVAGAGVEFDLSQGETDALWRAVGGDTRKGLEFLTFHRLAYLAFQLGAYAMAAQAHAGWPEEQARLRAARDGYAEKLRRTLQSA